MGSRIKCFMLEETDLVQQALRRYTDGGGECAHSSNWGYHQSIVQLDQVRVPEMPKDEYHVFEINTSIVKDGCIGPVSADDPRWPTHCLCGFKFEDAVKKQYFPRKLYRRQDNGALITLREAPPGAMWYADWLSDNDSYRGPDGRTLMVKLPNGSDWCIDSRANNCTLPQDTVHKCWVRHGVPPMVHVDKNGNTCAAGAGSIASGSGNKHYHGFLHNGELVEC